MNKNSENPSNSKNNKIKTSEKWNWALTIIATLGALLYPAWDIYSDWKKTNTNNEIHIQDLVDQARDYLGGDSGKARSGTKIITFSKKDPTNIEHAERNLRKAQKIDADNINVFWLEGTLLAFNGKCEEAIEKYKMTLSIDPQYAKGYTSLGVCYQQMNQFDEAISAFDKTIELQPDEPIAYSNLATAYLHNGDIENTLITLRKGIEKHPGCAVLITMLGVAYIYDGKYEESIEIFKRSLFLNQNIANTHYNLGFAYHKLKRYEEGLNAFKIATEIEPTYAAAFCLTGACLYRLKRYEEAIEPNIISIYLNPYDPDPHELLTLIYKKLGNEQKEKEYREKTYKLRKENNNKDRMTNFTNIPIKSF